MQSGYVRLLAMLARARTHSASVYQSFVLGETMSSCCISQPPCGRYSNMALVSTNSTALMFPHKPTRYRHCRGHHQLNPLHVLSMAYPLS